MTDVAIVKWKFTDLWSGKRYRCCHQYFENDNQDEHPIHGHEFCLDWQLTEPECGEQPPLSHTHDGTTHNHEWNGSYIEEEGSEEPLTWTFDINPNEGGSPSIEKQMNIQSNVGPRHGGIIQEGSSQTPTIEFGGVILTQEHYEMMEYWYTRRVLLDLEDDLHRKFRGVFSAFSPKRIRRAFNPWYHEYSASFLVWAYRNSSGQAIFGRMEDAT